MSAAPRASAPTGASIAQMLLYYITYVLRLSSTRFVRSPVSLTRPITVRPRGFEESSGCIARSALGAPPASLSKVLASFLHRLRGRLKLFGPRWSTDYLLPYRAPTLGHLLKRRRV